MSSHTTVQVQPRAPLSEEPVLPLPAPGSSSSHVDAAATADDADATDTVDSLFLLKAKPVKFCLQSWAWITHPYALNLDEVSLCPLHPILFLCSKPPIHPSAVVFGFRF